MGMHFGIIVADASWARFREALEGRMGPWIAGDANSEPLLAGELDGRAYVADFELVLSLANPDLYVNLSRELDCLVASGGGESSSGTYALVVARSGELIRHYFHCVSDLDQALSQGEPLPSEAEKPLDDYGGYGIDAALRHLGFEYERWRRDGSAEGYGYTIGPGHDDWLNETSPAGLGEAIEAHRGQHVLSEATPEPGALRTDDVAASTPDEQSPGWFARLRRWLGGG